MRLVLNLPKNSHLPVYIQVAEAIKQSIDQGTVKPGERLPSIKELSQSLNLARETVNRAYDHLSSQNYIKRVQGSGTYALQPPIKGAEESEHFRSGSSVAARRSLPLTVFAERLMESDSLSLPAPDATAELNYNAAMLEVLPINLWKKALYKSANMEDLAVVSYTSDPLGFRPLREAIAQYLGRARQIVCSADQIVVFTNTEAGTDKLARLIVNAGDLVALEEPGSPGVRTTFFAHQARVLSLPVDSEGLVVDALSASGEIPKLVYMTPAHHDPTGAVFSQGRREALLAWVKDKDCLIVEDDYDCEYYYGQRTLPALMSMDRHERVIYRYNFWKSLFPLVRIGFMVLPDPLVPVMARAKMLTERDTATLEQKALAEFLTLGYFERHLMRTRSIYETRRAAVVYALTRYCKRFVKIQPTSAGTHLLTTVVPEISEAVVESCAKQAGVPLVSTRDHYFVAAQKNEFIIAFSNSESEQIDDKFRQFGELLEKASARGAMANPDASSISNN